MTHTFHDTHIPWHTHSMAHTFTCTDIHVHRLLWWISVVVVTAF
jgi:hypothetical protein